MLNGGVCVEDWKPVCGFEEVVGEVGMTGWGEGLDDEGDKVSSFPVRLYLALYVWLCTC